MKNIFKILFASVLGLFILNSCDRTDDLVVGEYTSAPILENNLSATPYEVTGDNLATVFNTFTFQKAEFNVFATLTNQLEISVAGTDFKEVTNLGSLTEENTIPVLYSTLNNALLDLKLEAGVPHNIEIRVKSAILNKEKITVNPIYSNVLSFVVTPYLLDYPYTDLYLVGSATAAAWNNTAGNPNMYPLQKTTNLPDIYTYTGFFKGGADAGFKIIKNKGDWGSQYGLGSSVGQLSADGGSGNIPVSADGYYELMINITDLTYTLTPIATPTSTYPTVGIIGSATANGWDASTPMVKSSFDSNLWILDGVELSSGEMKFRANDSWDVNWGANTEYFGTATTGGANIPVSAGNYIIYFNDSTGNYTFILK
ncbi:MAG: SusF/SusE family outer membrane protein [Cruoricaptor ignavus]|nr:SusF/SusE family outer membrane protein [Cruoricaptor ignavus]